MNETIIPRDKRFVTVAAYQRMTGLSYKTVMNMIKTDQVRYITTDGGNYKIDTQSDGNRDNVSVLAALDETQRLIKALCKQFNTAIERA